MARSQQLTARSAVAEHDRTCPRSRGCRRTGFTLIELLVVVAIIVILLVAVVTVGGWAVRKGQSKSTEAMLRIVADACETFKQHAPLGAVKQPRETGGFVSYLGRYGNYPPDELEVFGFQGLPGSTPNPPDGRSLMPGGAKIVPDGQPPFKDMQFYTQGPGARPEQEHRDVAALVLAIELFSDEAKSVLGSIDQKYWATVGSDGAGKPLQFIDRDGDGSFTDGDEPFRYIVDDWRNPISYMAQRDFRPGGTAAAASTNHGVENSDWSWNEVSTKLVKLNGDAPVIFSYGPDGREQLTEANQQSGVFANLGADWAGADGSAAKDQIDNPMNADNVYANPAMAEILSRGRK